MLVVALTVVLICASVSAEAATYYVAQTGSDAHDGRLPRTAWRTLDRVNAAAFKPGDSVLFRRGDTWRGSLRPRNGAPGRPLTYGAFGRGAKPAFLGSVARNSPRDWRNEGDGVWSTGGSAAPKPVALPALSPAERAARWSLYAENGASALCASSARPDEPAGVTVTCAVPGAVRSDIQLITGDIRLLAGRTYRVVLRMRASQPIEVAMPTLMQPAPPWTGLSSGPATAVPRIAGDWSVVCQYYRASDTTDSARLTLYLGGVLPAGARLEVSRFSFAECPPDEVPADSVVPVDVGNLIFGAEQSCGVKVWSRADVNAQGRFWYSEREHKLYLYSDRNPAERYGSVECALYRHIIDEGGASYVTYENLALKYGGAHGIGGGGTHHITVRDCDISYIGGANQFGGDRRVRFGNGVEFWADAHDNLVERCRLWEIYDAALTNQNLGGTARQENITYRNNVIWNCEYSFEYWNRPSASVTRNIQFIHNTCVGAGRGWGHAQRPDPSGRHLCFYDSEAQESEIVVANNVFCDAAANAFYAPTWSRERFGRLRVDGNVWQQRSGDMMWVVGVRYPEARFAQYRAEAGQEAHSRAGDPLFRDAARRDYHLRPGSPCIGAGVELDVGEDFDRRPRRAGAKQDAGAFTAG
jgi:hypothetical protein